jgi:hypothetical protein
MYLYHQSDTDIPVRNFIVISFFPGLQSSFHQPTVATKLKTETKLRGFGPQATAACWRS